MCRTLIYIMIAFALLLSAGLAVAAEPDLAGSYACVGTTTGGKQYAGDVEIKKVRQGYQVAWQVAGAKYGGVGFIDEGRLNVAWATRQNNVIVTGVIVYEIQKNGELHGKWIDAGLGGIYSEKLRPAWRGAARRLA